MILYNVTVKITHEKHHEWLAWMREVHIPDVMKTGLFVENRICRLLHGEEDGVTYAFQYISPSMKHFRQYQDEHAPRLQKDHSTRFGKHYVAFRTLMEILES